MNQKKLLLIAYVSYNIKIIKLNIEMGAKDYLIKPIRLSECKALVSKMKKTTPTA